MKVAIYARVSTDQQNPDLQLRDLHDYITRRGLVLYDEYIDRGYTGSTEERPGLEDLMRDAKKKLFDVVLVWKFDRFARSTAHLVTVLDEFKDIGISFISFTEQIDTSTPSGKLHYTLIAAMAEFERSLIRERVKAGLTAAKARGVQLGRKRTLDWQQAYDLRDQNLSMGKIAERMGCSKAQVARVLSKRNKE